jgi:hypothetical protein
LGSTEETLIGRDQDEVVALASEILGEPQRSMHDDGVGGIDRMVLDVPSRKKYIMAGLPRGA